MTVIRRLNKAPRAIVLIATVGVAQLFLATRIFIIDHTAHRSVFPAIPSTFQPNVRYASDNELSQGVLDVPYAIPNIRCENGEALPHVRIGWFRSVLNIPHAFAVCSFADELAHAAKRDPKDYLLEFVHALHRVARQVIGSTG